MLWSVLRCPNGVENTAGYVQCAVFRSELNHSAFAGMDILFAFRMQFGYGSKATFNRVVQIVQPLQAVSQLFSEKPAIRSLTQETAH